MPERNVYDVIGSDGGHPPNGFDYAVIVIAALTVVGCAVLFVWCICRKFVFNV